MRNVRVLERALQIFGGLQQLALQPNVITYTARAVYPAQCDHLQTGGQCMLKSAAGIPAQLVTYSPVINACESVEC